MQIYKVCKMFDTKQGFILDFQFGGGRYFVWNRLSNENLTHLMRNAIVGPDLNEVNFNEILDICKEKNRQITLYLVYYFIIKACVKK